MRHVLIAAAVLALAACSPAPGEPEGTEAPGRRRGDHSDG